jgi:hypothetical protein
MVERQCHFLIGRHIAGGTDPAYDSLSHPMTHCTITHRHHLDKVCTHILSLLSATTPCRHYVLYITDLEAVDQWSHGATTVKTNAAAECLPTNAVREEHHKRGSTIP